MPRRRTTFLGMFPPRAESSPSRNARRRSLVSLYGTDAAQDFRLGASPPDGSLAPSSKRTIRATAGFPRQST